MIDLDIYSMAARILALKMTGQVGPRTFALLISHFRTVDNILLAEQEELMEIDSIGPERSKAIIKADEFLDTAQKTIDTLDASDTHVVASVEENYPRLLHELNDPPMLLYYKGRLPRTDEKRVAIIGSQNVSVDGIADAVELSRRLSEDGVAIVGGLARGIDTAGHMGALKANGATYAVLPSGFNNIYPAENAVMAGEITANGGLLSEYLPDTSTNAGRLTNRNRIIVGISQAVIIGEVSPESTGTLDAALCCHQLGKLLFTIIGANNPHYEKLALSGAIPLTTIDDYQLVLRSLV